MGLVEVGEVPLLHMGVPREGSTGFSKETQTMDKFLDRYAEIPKGERRTLGRRISHLDRLVDIQTKERLTLDLKDRLRTAIQSKFPDLGLSGVEYLTESSFSDLVGLPAQKGSL